jgi:stress response protein SCP2
MFTVSLTTTAGTIAHIELLTGPGMPENMVIELALRKLPAHLTMVRVLAVTYAA